MSVNHFPYLPLVTNPENKACIQTVNDPDHHQYLIICSLAHCQSSLKFCANPFGSFRAKLLTDRQTNKQTHNDEHITSLAEVTSENQKRLVKGSCKLPKEDECKDIMDMQKNRKKTEKHLPSHNPRYVPFSALTELTE